MQCYTEILPPSGITHALSASFTSATSNNLIVVKTSLLQIFDLVTDISSNNAQQPGEKETAKLKLLAEYELYGTVVDVASVKILNSKSGGDAVVLAFRNAKLSLIEWNPHNHGIATISIHYYEKEDITQSPWVSDLSNCGSRLTVDPGSRCALLNFGIRNLAVVPFHQAGDDLVMDDYDPGLDGGIDNEMQDVSHSKSKNETQAALSYQTPYSASFVLPLTALDPTLLHPIGLTFLHEYREPTFGILYSPVATSSALVHERKDVVVYSVFTLDLEQRASTSLLSVTKLPSDLLSVVALPPPVGGALLVGSNELIHVDQSGKSNAVGVNEFAKQTSSYPMVDRSDLALRLEGCVVETLDSRTGDMLLILSTGDLALIHFKLDGRSVSGLTIRPVPRNAGNEIMNGAASSSAVLGPGRIFIGSEDADSVVLDYYTSASTTKRSKEEDLDGLYGNSEDNEDNDNDIYEDDLYSTAPKEAPKPDTLNGHSQESYSFQLVDKLVNIGPLRSVDLGRPSVWSHTTDGNSDVDSSGLELVAASGSGKGGGVVFLQRELDLKAVSTFESDSIDCIWTVTTNKTKEKESPIDQSAKTYVFMARPESLEKEATLVYSVTDEISELVSFPDVNPNEDYTVEIGTLSGGSRVVQVLKGEVRIYDSDLGLAQIYPLWDEDEDDERTAVSASFADPYLLVLRDDSSLLLLQPDESGDLEFLSGNETIASQTWLHGCLYTDKNGIFKGDSARNTYAVMLSAEYKLYMFQLPDFELISVIEGVDFLPPILSNEPSSRRLTSRENITELLVADIGELPWTSPYLIFRTATDDLVIYKPYQDYNSEGGRIPTLKYIKEANHVLPTVLSEAVSKSYESQQRRRVLRNFPNIGGFASVFMPGASPSLILRTCQSSPHVFKIRSEFICGLGAFSISGCENGIIYVNDQKIARSYQLPDDVQFEFAWPLRRVPLGEQVDHVSYSTSSGTYVLGTSREQNFKLPDDDELHPEWRNEAIAFLPQIVQGSIKLLNPINWNVIDSYAFGTAEHITAMENVNLEISEQTQERKDVIVVGTTFAKGEDIAARGNIYVFDVIDVVPDPDQPGTNLKLKLIGKESIKGAVTALSGIGGQGFVMVSQGQKCMVRGLKDDGSLLPVAFIDVQCYVSVIKELKGTGMCLIGDALKGLWFAGYSEEPYKMALFGKDVDELEVVTADFLPDGKKLYILVADSDCNLHVLQYDPEDPKSSNGDRLLNRCKFHTGHFSETLTLLPRLARPSESVDLDSDAMNVDSDTPLFQAMVTTQTGAVAFVTTLSEDSYRRLSALQSQLSNTLEHPCGLNPRAYRAVESDGIGGRGMIDGKLLMRWLDLGRQRKLDIAHRVGADEWEIRADLEGISDTGLGYL
ncbi:putative cleavage and polyadenylation specificity factor subunit A [Talaromyces proteolyticus]|uniref:Protein CFT1 n=1 Tax=Talaromyces proteolyticus TaxID=1131652 RepID=A0AAD4L1F7_9EURO|nr:putative cleavage and polyadenylation specificity factor subunit A [Talaromyces proteolyticus]KAH8701144.1 putative cleavage and polyadenylation specificity factor subunit A [Talaromyces proteolyticus]